MRNRTIGNLTATGCLALLLAAPGCLFSPRDPEPPESGSAVDYLDQTNPTNVWANLGKSLENNDSGGWERNIGEDYFLYEPDSDAEIEFQDIFATPWEREQEVEFIRKFYSLGTINSDVKMRNDDFVVPPVSGTEVIWQGVIYELAVESGGSVTRYRGTADITFTQIVAEWYVTRWKDTGRADDPLNPGSLLPTFGTLRGLTASN